MKKIYVVMEDHYHEVMEAAYYRDETAVVQAFEDDDEASLFCREKNKNSCHSTFFIQEIKLKEKES